VYRLPGRSRAGATFRASAECARWTVRVVSRWSGVAGAVAVWMAAALAAAPASAQLEIPQPDSDHPISISAESGNRWILGSYEVWLLRGNCRIGQGPSSAHSREAVLWIARRSSMEQGQTKVIAYLEGDVDVEARREGTHGELKDAAWLGRFITSSDVYVDAHYVLGEPEQKPAIYQRAVARRSAIRDPAVQPAQHAEPIPPGPKSALTEPRAPGSQAEPPPVGSRRIRVFARDNVRIQAQWFPDPRTNQGIAVINSGVTIIVDGLKDYSSLDISADRMVIWTVASQEPGLSGQAVQDENTPLEIYMEGNVVFRQGQRVIYADRVYYNVNLHTGTVLGAEIYTPAPKFSGLLRLKADILRQTGRDRFFAEDMFITSSRMGEPRYRIQSGSVSFEDIQQPAINPFTGEPEIDPQTGQPEVDHQQLATAKNTFVKVGDVPVFYWPVLATDVSDPTYYIRRANYRNDNTFGHQILTHWDTYQLLGIRNKPAGTDWDLTLDYLTKRGFGHGTTFTYSRNGILGMPGPAGGLFDFWGIKDHGEDRLAGRGIVPPEASYRYRLFWQHRQKLEGGYQLTAEVGKISDRNFLEEYYLREWDELKDESTGVELKKIEDNTSWSVTGDVRVNDFFTQSDWLPRVDHFWLGQSLADDTFTWFEHSQAAYARFHTTTAPENANDQAQFTYLPWEALPGPTPLSLAGERLVTRQEIDWPFQAGPVKVVPYALGEAADWGADVNGERIQRLYWQAGVRASIPFWSVHPDIESQLLNVHGIAHKVVFDAEFAFAEANRDLAQFPLYDPLDDDSIEAFRRHFDVIGNTFFVPAGAVATDSTLPRSFQERYYALRYGLGSWVTSPSTEVADDLAALRLGMRHRWQTKRGPPPNENRRIVDWIVLDTNATWFPNASRDNDGQALGLVDYDFRWYVGDRLTLLSSGFFDFFPNGGQTVTIGGYIQRPPRMSIYAGIRFLEGPISSQVLICSVGYQMSPKWVGSVGTSIDLKGENIGQSVSVTRIGESMLITGGLSVDAIRGTSGVFFAIEPRFLPKGRLGGIGGRIPVAGLYGLE
jgi:hypothetical protein